MAQFRGFQESVHDHSGAEAGPKTKKEHAAVLVAAQCLHGSVIDHLDRTSERLLEVKPDPTRSQVVRFVQNPAVQHRPWVANGDRVVTPISSQFLDSADHLLCRHFGSGHKLQRSLLSGGKYLYVCSAYIDSKHLHSKSSSVLLSRGLQSR